MVSGIVAVILNQLLPQEAIEVADDSEKDSGSVEVTDVEKQDHKA